MLYDQENNIALIELTKGEVDNTVELGNFIIHVSKTKIPILIEILDASNFIGQFNKGDKETTKFIKKLLPANF